MAADNVAAAPAPPPEAEAGPSTAMVDTSTLHNPYTEMKKSLVVHNSSGGGTVAIRQRTKMHDPSDLIELARFVQQADSHTKAMVGGKLELISEQIKLLQTQAQTVLEDARRDLELSHAKCNFQRKPGNTYHLYKKELPEGGEEAFFSMLSPLEWSGNPPHDYIDSYRLEPDMSWTQVDRIVERDQKRQFNPLMLGLSQEQVNTNAEKLSLTMV
mmetsp:Transcript_16291/g.42268  ORF Transcript_16291/g.42268 Transcript_16291/m.42268 type:complete len:214 (+) Transcript_16291:276-917(+)|eukprot:CAMPEP_0182919422 /NCGR_PEP_ID=MMETSP0105_2-20130417/2712_1 /TAXON_ID=81532 ORGANISM="Acanthoeca-like sp., Strain 10tr" /NCGR_SAMPLE_ID=MMETSP0105_2 /ASSEMBLY_ACC=CAM_ASM_000205 /LENGTH=213 /DNA_ID=CAMNT_0025056607 /DNA_START=274 /DNA_END=915 /DNA_ORIENTATION=-